MMQECMHIWIKETHSTESVYYCENCGAFSKKQPECYIEIKSENKDECSKDDEFTKCRHIWRSLGDRCHHAKGKAGNKKYHCMKCELCGKFQRRT